MDTVQLRYIISNGIKGLPLEYLKEVADFVIFIRLRALQPHAFQQDDFEEMLHRELLLLSQAAQAHLEEEFADYQKKYPLE